MNKIKSCISILNPKNLFLKISFRILKSNPKTIRIIGKLINPMLVMWHIINLAHTKVELRRMNSKKSHFPDEDYPTYM